MSVSEGMTLVCEPSLTRLNTSLRPDFRSKFVHELAFGIPTFYVAPYDKINRGLVNLGYNFDVKSSLRLVFWNNEQVNGFRLRSMYLLYEAS